MPEDLLAKGVEIAAVVGAARCACGKHVTGRHPQLGYLAGLDADRAAALTEAWCDPDVDAVLCARGGYGSMRMVDLLDWEAMAAREVPPVSRAPATSRCCTRRSAAGWACRRCSRR